MGKTSPDDGFPILPPPPCEFNSHRGRLKARGDLAVGRVVILNNPPGRGVCGIRILTGGAKSLKWSEITQSGAKSLDEEWSEINPCLHS